MGNGHECFVLPTGKKELFGTSAYDERKIRYMRRMKPRTVNVIFVTETEIRTPGTSRQYLSVTTHGPRQPKWQGRRAERVKSGGG